MVPRTCGNAAPAIGPAAAGFAAKNATERRIGGVGIEGELPLTANVKLEIAFPAKVSHHVPLYVPGARPVSGKVPVIVAVAFGL